MKRCRKRRAGMEDKSELEMTPMIDVVFQLLIFFIVALKQQDLFSHMDISRPAPPDAGIVNPDIELSVDINKDGYSLRGRPMGVKELDKQLSCVAGFSKNVTVIIRCAGDSPHGRLVTLLDICAKNDLKSLSVLSLK